MLIPVGITARNEALQLPSLLKSLRSSINYAQKRSNYTFKLCLVLNDNTDNTLDIIDQTDLKIITSRGGIVEAQRALVSHFPNCEKVIFSDADLIISEDAILKLVEASESHIIRITYAEKIPLPPRSKTQLAKSLYLYNLNNGYQSHRHYFNGQLFLIKNWHIPLPKELNFQEADNNRFLCLEEGIRCDDIYLSRKFLCDFGPEAIKVVNAHVFYRPPELLVGMYRKYQRMVLEKERLDFFIPQERQTKIYGKRSLVLSLLLKRPKAEIYYYLIFIFHLRLCKLYYLWQKFIFSYISKSSCPHWLPVEETKAPYESLP